MPAVALPTLHVQAKMRVISAYSQYRLFWVKVNISE